MKVLFAVNDDNISNSVITKYQQKYKEIITSKSLSILSDKLDINNYVKVG